MMPLLPKVRRALPAARFPFSSARVGVAMAFSATAAAALRASRLSPVRAELLAAVAGLVPPAVALRSRELAQYHGAEHKTIGAYETGGEAVDATKEHERCGSHLIGPLLLGTVAANAVAARVPARHRSAARAGGSLAALGVAVELFGWMDRHRNSPLSRALARPGHVLQAVASTAEPDERQLEVAGRALDELLRLERDAAAEPSASDPVGRLAGPPRRGDPPFAMSGFRFVHAADLHLDTPFEGLARTSPEVAAALRDASLDAFDALVELTLREDAAFLVIAGRRVRRRRARGAGPAALPGAGCGGSPRPACRCS